VCGCNILGIKLYMVYYDTMFVFFGMTMVTEEAMFGCAGVSGDAQSEGREAAPAGA